VPLWTEIRDGRLTLKAQIRDPQGDEYGAIRPDSEVQSAWINQGGLKLYGSPYFTVFVAKLIKRKKNLNLNK
jgi:hypothetical protein